MCLSPKSLPLWYGRMTLVEQIASFTKEMVVKQTLPCFDDVHAPPHMSFRDEIVKDAQHTMCKAKQSSSTLLSWFLFLTKRTLLPWRLTQLKLHFLVKIEVHLKTEYTQQNMRWVHVSNNSADLRNFCYFQCSKGSTST